jgi:hypothetical protein
MERMSRSAPWYRAWANWRLAGSPKGKRPASAPKHIPDWAWDRYKKEYALLHPKPPPVPFDPTAPYRSVLFLAGSMLDVLQAPTSYKAAVTADPTYDQHASADQSAQLRAAGYQVYVWYVPTEVSKQRAEEVANRLSASRIIGQAESTAQYAASKADGLKAVVGNITSLNGEQLAEVAAAQMIFVNETYYNVQPWLKPDWRNANDGIAGNCLAVYGSTSEGAKYTPLVTQPFVRGRDSVYAVGMQPEDWAVL